jgi:hydrogenase nickel incorporation protein HypB
VIPEQRVNTLESAFDQGNEFSQVHRAAAQISIYLDIVINALCRDGLQVPQLAVDFDLDALDILIVENVGNLVCPAEFDLGEDARAAVLSITEGNDKPVKYPLVFRESEVVLINKIDLLPYTDCDIDLLEGDLKKINPELELFRVSVRLDQGFEPWIDWLEKQVNLKK